MVEVFQKIGNALSLFVEVDLSFRDTSLMVVVNILVNINLRDELA